MKQGLLLGLLGLLIVGGLVWYLESGEVDNIENTELETELETPAEASSTLPLTIHSPKAQQMVSSPLRITGEAPGTWYFEASFPVVVTDWDGRIIGQGIATAKSDWMTTEMVPFSGEVDFTVPVDTAYKRGTVIFKKDNPSGLPENAAAVEIPIQFADVPDTEGPIVIGVGDSAQSNGVRITLNEILEDSRCPTDVQCIQAGRVMVGVRLASSDQEKTTIIASDDDAVQFAGTSISILEVVPAARSTTAIDDADYQITFAVTKSSS